MSPGFKVKHLCKDSGIEDEMKFQANPLVPPLTSPNVSLLIMGASAAPFQDAAGKSKENNIVPQTHFKVISKSLKCF